MKKILSVVGISLLMSSNCFAATYTVCASGCDETTIQGCSTNRVLTADDICLVSGGTYTGQITWNNADVGTSGHPVVIQCAPGATCVIDAGGASYGFTSSAGGIDYITLHGFTVQNYTSRGVWLDGVSGVADEGVSVIDISCSGGTDGVWVRNKQNSVFRGITATGITGRGFSNSNTGTVAMAGNVYGDISVTNGGTSNSVGAITIESQGDFTIDDDFISVDADAASTGISFRYLTGVMTVNSGVTLQAVRPPENGLYIDQSNGATLNVNGRVVVDHSGGTAVTLSANTFQAGSYFNRIETDYAGSAGINNSSSNLTFKSYEILHSTANGVSQSGGTGIVYTSDFSLGYGNSEIAYGTFDGWSAVGTSSALIEKTYIHDNGGHDGVPTNEGDGITGHDTTVTVARYNVIKDNDNTCFAFIAGSTLTGYNNTCIDNGVAGGPRAQIWSDNDTNGINLKNTLVYGGLPYCVAAYDATALPLIKLDYSAFYQSPSAAHFSTSDNGTTTQDTLAAWQSVSGEDANSRMIGATVSGYVPGSSTLSINHGAFIAGLHDQSTRATDFLNRYVVDIPDIGAIESQGLHFDSSVTDANENGSSSHPFNAFSDYTFTGYNLRSGAVVNFSGAPGSLDLSGLTDTGAVTIKAWKNGAHNLSGFVTNGDTVLGIGSGGLGGLYGPLW